MDSVRLGVIGLGTIGRQHADNVLTGKIRRCRLAAVADANPAALAPYQSRPEVQCFAAAGELIRSGEIDAVVIATPHFDHTVSGIAALKAGLHVMVEKPISVHKSDAERLIAAHTDKGKVFAAMFNQRTIPQYRKVKALIDQGELGNILRVNWIITNWFRSDYYYSSGGWRATWHGEGGGVLMNQCPHQLDLLQWLCGMPSAVRAFCHLGKHHQIEVEDEVTAYLEYPNGATGVFITSTGEAPGTNRLEICGERGKVVVEGDQLHFTRNEASCVQFARTSKTHFGKPAVWNIEIPCAAPGNQHAEALQNFVNAILDGEKLIAPAEEGLNSIELANAMLYSSLTEKTVQLPLDGKKFERVLKGLVSGSNGRNGSERMSSRVKSPKKAKR